MSTCSVPSHPEMYGLGIRTAFYIHWLGDVLITHLGDISPITQASSLVLSISVTIALVIQVAGQALEPAEIYVLLLLASGMYLPLIPVYILKFVSFCHPALNAMCWLDKKSTAAWIRIGMFIEAIGVAAVGLWFWATFVPSRNETSCVQYGFFFAAVMFENLAFNVFNALLYVGFIIACAVLGLEGFGCFGRTWRRKRRKYRKRDRSEAHLWWKRSYMLSSLVISSITIAAIELSISYNNIENINDLTTSAQLYPLMVSVLGLVIILFHQYQQYRLDMSQEDSSGPVSPRTTASSRFPPGPPPAAPRSHVSPYRGSAADTRATTVSATTASSLNDNVPPPPESNEPDQGFPPGWTRHEDVDGRFFWLPMGRAPVDGASDTGYPPRARTVR